MPLNYSFDCAGIRYISLETPDPDIANSDDPQPSRALADRQESWLRQELDNSLPGTIVIQHYPNRDESISSVRPEYASWDALYNTYPVSASFAGHVHNYERFLVDKVPYFIVGNAGGPSANLTDIKPAGYQFGTTRRLGYLKLTLDPEKNMATAQSMIVGYVDASDDDETPHLYNPPVIDETVTFPLLTKGSPSPTTGVPPGKTSVTTPSAASFFTRSSGVGSSFVVIFYRNYRDQSHCRINPDYAPPGLPEKG